MTQTAEQIREALDALRIQARQAQSDSEMQVITNKVKALTRDLRRATRFGVPATPIDQASEIDSRFRRREHLEYLSERVAQATEDVENGQNRMLAVSMPPRSGKSTLLSLYTPLWFMRTHPDWKVISASFDGNLTGEWSRNVRTLIEDDPDLGVVLQRDGGAGSHWSTVEGGGLYSASIRSALTGRGAKVFIIDDPIKDYVDAHSATMRETLWNWWLSVAQTRLEPPYLVIAVMTRWHEDDLIGRLLSAEHEGDPTAWEVISIPAIAPRGGDGLGREPGAPLLSPLLDETEEEATARWDEVKRTVGSYVWASMYQQTPAPAKGAIFDAGWWKYWTRDPAKATEDGRVVYIEPSEMTGARWLDSWDCAFKGTDSSDYVVGQRWFRYRADRFLVAQVRKRMSFTSTLAAMRDWSDGTDKPGSPWGNLVHQRLVEEKANGAAIINTMQKDVAGLKPVVPKDSKEARARNVTPEVESGNVYLPHPTDPGNGWVHDLLSELRNFPFDAHDDQVDSLTQALNELRDQGLGSVTVPGAQSRTIQRNVAAAARSSMVPRAMPGTRRPPPGSPRPTSPGQRPA